MNPATISKTQTIIPNLEAIKGCQFVSFTYTAKNTGETSKVTVSLGVSYENAKKADLAKIKNFAPQNPLQDTAKEQLIKSIVAPDPVRSQAQADSKIPIVKGIMDYCPNTGNILLFGMLIRKEVITAGEYKKVNSRPLTIEKNRIKKELDFRTEKFRKYILENTNTFRIQGETLFLN